MSVGCPDSHSRLDYSGKELPPYSDLVYYRLLFGVSRVTHRNLGLSENPRHLARQVKVGVESSESGVGPTMLKVLNQLTPKVELPVEIINPLR